ncbi:MAG: uncharacterized protein A8A55_2666 [Amphiamblys sp. WSBS2006]|nr:MAG: uncharacterized protein A8A55_2666 [Amphiamblys sp. WSBS2006]
MTAQGHRTRPRFLSWNVRTRRDKTEELHELLHTEAIDVAALQETRTAECSFVAGYKSFVPSAQDGRGVELLVKKTLKARQIPSVSPHIVAAEIGGLTGVICLGVYVPHDGRMPMLNSLAEMTKSLNGRQRNILICGDWNMGRADTQDWLDRVTGGSLTQIRGKPATFHGDLSERNLWTEIDHAVTIGEWPSDAWSRVDRGTLSSDHWPLITHVELKTHLTSPEPTDNSPRFLRSRIIEKRLELQEHPLVTGLAGRETVTVDELGDVLWRSGTDLKLTTSKPGRPLVKNLSSAVKRLLEKRRRHLREIRDLSDSAERTRTLDRWRIQSKEIRRVLREERRKAWSDGLDKIGRDLSSHDLGEVWRAINRLSGRKKGLVIEALQSNSGDLVSSPEDTARVMASHFEQLLGATPNQPEEPTRAGSYTKQALGLPELNEDISLAEVLCTMAQMRNGKAPGLDGLPLELVKPLRYEVNPLTVCLWKALNHHWITGTAPRAWKEAMVVPIFKKGSPTDPSNYRGIALTSALAKVMMRILAKRLSAFLKKNDMLSQEQAGFREREEAVIQAAALLETCTRRLGRGMDTHLVFLDFKKAYDTVPQQGLFEKMQVRYGISRDSRLSSFLASLYEGSGIRIRVNGVISERITTSRGLRQGCPLSPILFNMYIDDLLDGTRGRGATVPRTKKKVSGLLYADDAVLLADNRTDLVDTLKKATSWAKKWGMELNIEKCGEMLISPNPTRHEDSDNLEIQNQPIPKTESYTYLGVEISKDLRPSSIEEARRLKAGKALGSMTRLLKNPTIPLKLKALAIQNGLIPASTYGLCLAGTTTSALKKVQKIINQAVRYITGPGSSSTAGNQELEIPQ